MKPVRIVFSGRSAAAAWWFGNASAVRPLAALLLLGACAGLAAVAWESWEIRQQIHSAQGALAVLRSRGAGAAASASGKFAMTAQQSRDWNQLVRRLNTPWPAILDALETTLPETVALVAIEPDPNHASVRLQVEAKTLDALLGYAQVLQTAAPFDDVVLLKHETNDQDPMRPIRLSLDARLKPRERHAFGSLEAAR